MSPMKKKMRYPGERVPLRDAGRVAAAICDTARHICHAHMYSGPRLHAVNPRQPIWENVTYWGGGEGWGTW